MSFIRTDVTVDQRQGDGRSCRDRFGRLDCLVNNAGSGSPIVSITEVVAEHFSSVFDTNVRGVLFGMKHAAPIMITQGSGSIALPVCAAASPGIFTVASKAAVIHLSRNVASEIRSRGVRVNTTLAAASRYVALIPAAFSAVLGGEGGRSPSRARTTR
jgi:NAD(P)-dependent dehydrogenase (short-subunit alcohol dehydrogenase family)